MQSVILHTIGISTLNENLHVLFESNIQGKEKDNRITKHYNVLHVFANSTSPIGMHMVSVNRKMCSHEHGLTDIIHNLV